MEQKKGQILLILTFSMVLIINGCAGPKIRPQSTLDRINIQSLQENWEDYDVSYAGWSVTDPYGIMFDPKDNDIKLGGNRWKKIKNQETLAKVIDALPKFTYPSQIKGKDDKFFGYIYYIKKEGWDTQRAVVKVVDDHTLTIDFETLNTGLQRPEY